MKDMFDCQYQVQYTIENVRNKRREKFYNYLVCTFLLFVGILCYRELKNIVHFYIKIILEYCNNTIYNYYSVTYYAWHIAEVWFSYERDVDFFRKARTHNFLSAARRRHRNCKGLVNLGF